MIEYLNHEIVRVSIWGAIIMAVFVKYVLPTFITKGIETQFNKKLEEHKHSLQLIAESEKFEYQKMLADFNLFASKKHASLALLYESLIETQGAVFEFASVLKQTPSGETWNKQDYEDFLNKCELSQGERDELVCLWVSNPSKAKSEIFRLLNSAQDFRARNSLTKLKNHNIRARIFMTEELHDKVQKAIQVLYEFYWNGNKLSNRELMYGENSREVYSAYKATEKDGSATLNWTILIRSCKTLEKRLESVA